VVLELSVVNAVDQPSPLLEVFPSRTCRARSVIAKDVLERRHRAIGIKGESSVGNRKEEDAPRPQHTEHALKSSEWVFTVLEEVVRDHEILGGIGETRQTFAVVDNVDRYELLTMQLRILALELRYRHPIHVADSCGMRNRKGIVERAYFDAVSLQIAVGDRFAPERYEAIRKEWTNQWETAQQAVDGRRRRGPDCHVGEFSRRRGVRSRRAGF
jgi:hypothetical protein